jgi:DNA-binding winged helix-turn-helix (wHTH) protein
MAADENPVSAPCLTFGEYRLDCNLKRLFRGTESIKLTPKPFDTLEFLINNRERVVSKDEILSKVWREQRDQNTVDQAVGKLRKALGDDPARPRYIETVPGQGYHFIARVASHNTMAPENVAMGEIAFFPAGTQGSEPAPADISKTPWRVAGIGLAGLGIVIIGVLLVLRLTRAPNPQQATVVGTELTALDGAGHAIWHYQFPRPLMTMAPSPDYDLDQNSQKHVGDLNGDGKNEVLIAASYGAKVEAPDELYCFAPGGRLLWRYQPQADFSFVGRRASGPWKLEALTVVPDNGNAKAVWAAFSDPVYAPTIVASVDAAGHSQIRYVSSGNVHALISVGNANGTFILAGGVNNEYRAASLTVLDTRQQPAASPQTPGNRFQCTNCPSGRPRLFVLLPRSEVNIGSGLPYNHVTALFRRGGTISMSVMELRGPGVLSSTAEIEFSADFIPSSITFGAGYKEAHDRLQKQGLIDHKWSDCQEQMHPAIARAWDEANGWREIQIPWVH